MSESSFHETTVEEEVINHATNTNEESVRSEKHTNSVESFNPGLKNSVNGMENQQENVMPQNIKEDCTIHEQSESSISQDFKDVTNNDNENLTKEFNSVQKNQMDIENNLEVGCNTADIKQNKESISSEENTTTDSGIETVNNEESERGAEGGFYPTTKKIDRKNRFSNDSQEEISPKLIERFSNDTEDSFEYFWQSNSLFSQWYIAPFSVEGEYYNCAEQYMMHQKALLMEDEESAGLVMALKEPQEQKSIGRSVKNWNEEVWLQNRLKIVKKGNMAKFTQNQNLKEILVSTFPKILVEASPYDKVWGIGLRAHDKRAHNRAYWKGENLLGYVLTEVRDEIMRDHGMMDDCVPSTDTGAVDCSPDIPDNQNGSRSIQETLDLKYTSDSENIEKFNEKDESRASISERPSDNICHNTDGERAEEESETTATINRNEDPDQALISELSVVTHF